jgi:hypothetical protein
VAVGTPQHIEDLYFEIMASRKYENHRLPAVLDEEKHTVLWPDRYSYDDLMEIKERIGTLAFMQEYMLEPISDETSIFPPSLFEPLKNHELSYQDSYHGPKHSYMYTPINYWRAQPKAVSEQLDQVEQWCLTYDPVLGYLEANMFQRIYSEHFKESSLPLSGHVVTNSNKNSLEHGVLSFRPLFENGRFQFPYKTPLDKQKTDRLIQEFTGIRQRKGKIGNESTHDDIVMALWHAYRASKQGTTFNYSF